MKAKKLPSGSWRVLAYIGTDESGKEIRKSFTAADKRTAMANAAAYIDQHRNTSISATFGAASEAYLRTCKANYSPSTHAGYVSVDLNPIIVPIISVYTRFFNIRVRWRVRIFERF